MSRRDGFAVRAEAIPELRVALAGNPSLPTSLVDQLITNADTELCLAIAQRDDLTNTQVNRLMARGGSPVAVRLIQRGLLPADRADACDPEVIVAFAELGVIPTKWAWRAARNPDPRIRMRLAEAAHTPDKVLSHLAQDSDVDVVAAVAGSAGLTAAIAEPLAHHRHLSVRRALACNEHTPKDLLRAICAGQMPPALLCPACDGSRHGIGEYWTCDGTHGDALDDLAYALTLNPSTPADVITAFAAHPSVHVRWQLAQRIDLPAGTYHVLADDPISGIRGDVAANPAIDENLVRVMADDDTYDVRRRLAHNPHTPLDVLVSITETAKIGPTLLPRIAHATVTEIEALAASAHPAARMLVAQRPDLPTHIVNQLADDPDAKVVKSIAVNTSLTDAQLHTMLDRHGIRVAAQIAANPNCTAELLIRLASHEPPVQKALRRIAQHPNSPVTALRMCLTDPRSRRIAATHPALSPEMISELLSDPDIAVATSAATNPSLPASAMQALLAGVDIEPGRKAKGGTA